MPFSRMKNKRRQQPERPPRAFLRLENHKFCQTPRPRSEGQNGHVAHPRIESGQQVWKMFDTLDHAQPTAGLQTSYTGVDPVGQRRIETTPAFARLSSEALPLTLSKNGGLAIT